jgi:RNA polymerase sigma-70 factor (ECF subfamily)
MGPEVRSDEDLLASRDGESFELFYLRHAERMLGYFARRTRDPELAADLTAETFAAALASRRRYRRQRGLAGAWLYGIAFKKLTDAQRRGYAERRACRRVGVQRIDPTDADLERIENLAGIESAALIEVLVPDQRVAVKAHVVDEREYSDIARDLNVSEAVVRKRVSRGLAALRDRIGSRP